MSVALSPPLQGVRVRTHRPGWAAVLIAALWLALTKAMEWPALARATFESRIATDAAAFAYAGQLVRHGGVPYVTFWDHKPPLIYFIDAAALTLSGGEVWGIWLAGCAALVLAVVLAARVFERAGLGLPALLVGIACFAAALPDVRSSNLTEEYLPPLQWAAVLLLTGLAPGAALRFWRGLALGVLAALAALLRPNLGGAMAAVALVLTIEAMRLRLGRDWLRWLGGVIAGTVGVLAIVLAWLAAHGALAAFWDQVIRYNFLYASAGWRDRLKAAFLGTQLVTRHAPLLFPLAGWLVAAVRLGRRREESAAGHALLLLALVWAPFELLLASTAGRTYDHYFLPLIAPFALLAAILVAELLAWRAPAGDRAGVASRARLLGAALAVGIALPAVADQARRVNDVASAGKRTRQVAEVAAYLRSHTPPHAPVFVWGHAADVYFFSHRPAASRFIYPLALVTPGYADSALVAGFLRELDTRRPELIIEQPTPLLPALERWDPDWRYPVERGGEEVPGHWQTTPALAAFYRYFAAHYTLADSVGPERWRVYRRRATPPGAVGG